MTSDQRLAAAAALEAAAALTGASVVGADAGPARAMLTAAAALLRSGDAVAGLDDEDQAAGTLEDLVRAGHQMVTAHPVVAGAWWARGPAPHLMFVASDGRAEVHSSSASTYVSVTCTTEVAVDELRYTTDDPVAGRAEHRAWLRPRQIPASQMDLYAALRSSSVTREDAISTVHDTVSARIRVPAGRAEVTR